LSIGHSSSQCLDISQHDRTEFNEGGSRFEFVFEDPHERLISDIFNGYLLSKRPSRGLRAARKYLEVARESGRISDKEYSIYHGWILLLYSRDVSGISAINALANARKEFEDALRPDSSAVAALFSLVIFHKQAPRIAGSSKKELSRHLEYLEDKDPNVYNISKAFIYADDEKWADFDETLISVKRQGNIHFSHYALTLFLIQAKQYKRAVDLLEIILLIGGDRAWVARQFKKLQQATEETIEPCGSTDKGQ